MTVYHVSARQQQEGVMELKITTWLPPSTTAGALTLTLETLCFPAAMETQMQRALSSSCLELKTCKQGFGRKVNERETRAQGYFWMCAQDFEKGNKKNFPILKLLLVTGSSAPYITSPFYF